MIKKIFLTIKKVFYLIDNLLHKLPIIRKRIYLKQLIKFTISGILMTLLDFFVYIILTRGFLFWEEHYLWANFLAMAVGATGSFILNKLWTFNDYGKRVFVKYIKFWIVAITGLLIYQVLFFAFVQYAELYDLLAKIISALIVMLFRFNIQKFWVFK